MLTTQKPVIESTRDEIVRLMHLQKQILADLIHSPELFDGADKKMGRQTIDVAKAKEFSKDLDNEITKAKNLELVVAVVGTMKAGKSTTINAIVGMEVLPNRSEAMTTLPTAIRHKAGLTEPELTFTLNAPFNELIKQLAGPYRQQLEKLRNPDNGAQAEGMPEDVRTLVDDFLAGKVAPLKTRYVGREAIYGFLHRLNDLVRLADLAKVPQSPLDAYTQIDHFPLIEVEFSHLKSIEGHGNGKFTLLDTPGPNEATRGVALRKVLQEQLRKASAILAVIDYTQRDNDADKELRDFLADVIEEKADRFYVVVNKFDQRGPNDSKDTNVARAQIASRSFQGKVKAKQVFPVSSQLAYYANAALRELDTHGALPLKEGWVQQFGKLAFGTDKMAARMLPDAEAVREYAADLLADSLFSDLTKPVIQDGYPRAAFMAMDSAIDLLQYQSKDITDFLGFRTHAIGQQTNALKKLVDGLQGDVAAVQKAAKALRQQAETARQKLQRKVNVIQEQTGENVNGKLLEFFKSGQRITEATNQKRRDEWAGKVNFVIVGDAPPGNHDSFVNFLPQGLKNSLSQKFKKEKPKLPEGQLFDPEDPKVVFDEESEANDFSAEVKKEITVIVEGLAPKIEEEFNAALSVLSDEMRREVTERYLKPIAARAEADVKNGLGFVLKIDLSNAPLPISDVLNLGELGGQMTNKEIEKEQRTRLVAQEGFWGGLKRGLGGIVSVAVDNDWGKDWETYSVYLEYYVVDLERIKERVLQDIKEGFEKFGGVMKEHIETVVMPEIDEALQKLSNDLEGYRGNLLQSIQDQNKSQEEQEKIKQVLEHLAQLQKKVHADTLVTKTELTAVEKSTQFA